MHRYELSCFWIVREISKSTSRNAITISRGEASRISESLTTLLARIGFDEHYELTPEGKLIERLIDLMIES